MRTSCYYLVMLVFMSGLYTPIIFVLLDFVCLSTASPNPDVRLREWAREVPGVVINNLGRELRNGVLHWFQAPAAVNSR